MKRLLSLFLAFCTVLSSMALCPMPVFAADTESSSAEISVQPQISKNEPQDILDESVENILTETEPLALLEETLGDCKILQHVDADAFAQSNHAFRMPELETMDTYVFQNNDGTRSVYYMNEAVKYTDSLGNIREKDLTLRAETRGYRIGENEFDLFLPFSIADGVALTYEGYEVKLAPTGGNALATVQNNAVVYDEYFGAGTSLRYTPMLSGVKEEIILDNYVPDRTFTFVLITDGLFLAEQDGRYVLAEDKDGRNVVLYLGEIVVYDALGKPSLGIISVETIKEGLGYMLTVAADEAFLSDPTTVYPVTIDPNLTIKDTASSVGNLTDRIEDATIFSGTPNTNTGSWVYLTAGYTDDTYKVGRVLVRLPGLYNSTDYARLTANDITSVKFYCYDSTENASQPVYLIPCTSSTWTESTVTWNSFNGAYDGSNIFPANMAPNVYTEYNITQLVKGWKNGTYQATAGFMLANFNESDVSKKKGPFASEYSNQGYRPYVMMTYTEPAEEEEETPTISLPSISSVALGQNTTLTAATTPVGASVTWGSTNTEVATVSSTGVVTGKKIGTTTIIARIANTSVFAECTLYVHLPNGTYYLNSSFSSKYLNNNNGTPNGYSAPMSTLATSAAWEFIYQSPGRYYIRSCVSPYLYLADTSSGTSSSVGLVAISSLTRNQCLWTIEKSEFFNELTLTSYYGRKLYSIGSVSESAIATLGIATYPPHTEKWRYVHEDDMVELTTFSVNLDEIECFETAEFRVFAGGNGQSFVGTHDFSFEITSGASNISLSTNGTIFASMTGKNVGTSKITVTYKVSGLSKTFEVNVTPYPFVIGMSTDNYLSSNHHNNLGVSLYAQNFYNTISFSRNTNFLKQNVIWHNNTNTFGSASKMDFETIANSTGAIADSVDFMIYMGHGLAANRDTNGLLVSDREKGNYLHYNYGTNGAVHNNGGCYNDSHNLYTSEARFEHPRWVWLYTCNFLNRNEYVSEADLVAMMAGTHILMGYSTQSLLADSVSQTFAQKLSNNRKIIDSFFIAGDSAESKVANDNHIQKVLYVLDARDETIFSSPISYEYTSADVYMIENGIKDDIIWK